MFVHLSLLNLHRDLTSQKGNWAGLRAQKEHQWFFTFGVLTIKGTELSDRNHLF
jgi:hypothetical protein